MGKKLTLEELEALKSVGIIAENWFAVTYDETQMPFALFNNEQHAKAYRDQYSVTSIIKWYNVFRKDFKKTIIRNSFIQISR